MQGWGGCGGKGRPKRLNRQGFGCETRLNADVIQTAGSLIVDHQARFLRTHQEQEIEVEQNRGYYFLIYIY